jgi:dihydrolipoamide dehydrogenase
MKYDIAILGGGPAGYTAAEKAASAGQTVLLMEKNALGGVCLNEGCIPTKTLLYSAKTYDTIRHAHKYGISAGSDPTYDLPRIILRKNKTVKKLTAGIRMSMEKHNVTHISGEGIIREREADGTIHIECNGTTYRATTLIICTGSETIIPPIPGLDSTPYITSREALSAQELPPSVNIIGGGVIGMEFASYYNSLGAAVNVIEMQDEILPGFDRETTAMLKAEYTKRGVKFHTSHRVTSVRPGAVITEKDGTTTTLEAATILLSVGRRPFTKGYGLETLSLDMNRSGIKVNHHMQTSHPNVYACGDITGHSMLAHTAEAEAEAAVRHITGNPKPMSYKAIPSIVYTNPEIASIGATEEQLITAGHPYNIRKIPMAATGRFVAENEQVNGLCKLITTPEGILIGAHLLGNPASELIIIAGIAIEQGMKAIELAEYIYPHPTVGEIFRC